MSSSRTLRISSPSKTNAVLLTDEDLSQPIYTGKLAVGEKGSTSTVELYHSDPAGEPQSPVGVVSWNSCTGQYDLTLSDGSPVNMKKRKKRQTLSLGRKTHIETSQGVCMWKDEGKLRTAMQLVDSEGNAVARLGDILRISLQDMGKVELEGNSAVVGQFMDEVVLSALGMMMQEKTTEVAGIAFGSIDPN